MHVRNLLETAEDEKVGAKSVLLLVSYERQLMCKVFQTEAIDSLDCPLGRGEQIVLCGALHDT